MCDNRTDEFFQLVQSLPASLSAQPASITSQGIGASNSSNPNTLATSTATGRYGGGTSPNKQHPQANTELRSFHLTAADISKDIAATSIMLSQLTQLVKEKSLFVDDSSNVNGLVMRIKGNIESLNGRLDEANTVISTQKRRLGKNSQAGQEASNVVGQLKEEFVQATTGFKKVLQARTDSLKDKSDQKRQVYGAEGTEERNQMSGGAGADPSLVSLENKPAVYNQTETSSRNLSSTTTSAGNHAAISSFPTIDLTSQFMSPGESTASSSQLPRPRECVCYVPKLCVSCHMFLFTQSIISVPACHPLRIQSYQTVHARTISYPPAYECGERTMTPCKTIRDPPPLIMAIMLFQMAEEEEEQEGRYLLDKSP